MDKWTRLYSDNGHKKLSRITDFYVIVTNFGGGNTSAKLEATDPLTGEATTVLWVKGSGGDIGSMKLDGFSTLYLEKLLRLETLYRGVAFEDEMVGYLLHCTFNLNPRAASIDTPLHAYVPKPYVDHMHPDAIIAIAAAKDSRALTKEIFGDRVLWVPWRRPGFQLGLDIAAVQRATPQAVGVLLGGHGITAWGSSSDECETNSRFIIDTAAAWIAANGRPDPFGKLRHPPLPDRRERAAALFPLIRGLASTDRPQVGHYTDTEVVLDFW